MRAWLLLLAVLATFQMNLQVASTEDTSKLTTPATATFITAITKHHNTEIATIQQHHQQQHNPVHHSHHNKLHTHKTSANKNKQKHLKDIKKTHFYESASGSSASEKLHQNHKHQQQQAKSSSDSDIIIEIKNFEEIETVPTTKSQHQVPKSVSEQQTKGEEKAQLENTKLNLTNSENNKHNLNKTLVSDSKMAVVESENTQTIENTSETTTSTTTSTRNVEPDLEQQHDDRISSSSYSSEDDEEPTFADRELLIEKVQPDPTTLVEIENSLLSLFNMKRPPTIDRSKIIIPDAMKELYAQMMGQDIDSVNIPKPGLLTKSANTVRSFTHKDSKIDDRFPHHHRFRLYFDTNTIPAEEKLKAAELQLSRDAISHAALNPRLANRTRYQVLVYDITRVGVRGKREPSYLLLDNKTIRLNSTETVSLDVQPAVDRWLASPKRNYGLLVEVRTMRSLKPAPQHHVRLRRSADEPHESWQRKQPLLFTYTDDGRHKSRSIRDVSSRSKRAGRKHRRKNTEEICHRKSLYVDFSDVGWANWIVAPPGYDAYYCHGKCPFPLADHLNSTNHAVVQTLVNNINPEKVPKACCVPTQLEGISMLYLNDQNTVVLKNYQDMTVVGCGCR